MAFGGAIISEGLQVITDDNERRLFWDESGEVAASFYRAQLGPTLLLCLVSNAIVHPKAGTV